MPTPKDHRPIQSLIDDGKVLPDLYQLANYQHLIPKKIHIRCHKDAANAYLAWYSISKKLAKESNQALPIDTKKTIAPIFLIKESSIATDRPIYYFFTLFQNLEHLIPFQNFDKLPCFVINDNKLTSSEIRIFVWQEVADLVNQDLLKSASDVSVIRSYINDEMPDDLIERFFKAKKLTIPKMCELIGIKQKKYEYLQSKLKEAEESAAPKLNTPFTFKSILERAK